MLDLNKESGATGEIRRARDAREYAETTKAVGAECGIPVLDIWSSFMDQTGWQGQGPLPGSEETGKNGTLASLLHDGKKFHY